MTWKAYARKCSKLQLFSFASPQVRKNDGKKKKYFQLLLEMKTQIFWIFNFSLTHVNFLHCWPEDIISQCANAL